MANEVVDHFKFTFKLWKQITHAKGLHFQELDVKNFMDAIDNVGGKKGCLLIQFPASFKSQSIDQLNHLLRVVQANNANHAWKIVIEFRDTSCTLTILTNCSMLIPMHTAFAGQTCFFFTTLTNMAFTVFATDLLPGKAMH